jgi:hypothetical protein
VINFSVISNKDLVNFVITNRGNHAERMSAIRELIRRNKILKHELEILGVKPVVKNN